MTFKSKKLSLKSTVACENIFCQKRAQFLIIIKNCSFHVCSQHLKKINHHKTLKNYKVSIQCCYSVSINAESESEARRLVEYFLGIPEDASSTEARLLYNFNIENDIELLENNAVHSERIEEPKSDG